MSSILCCFNNLNRKILAIVAVSAHAFGFFFLIWGVAVLGWARKSAKALYWIGFVLIILSLFGTITILIMTLLKNQENSETINKIGRFICYDVLGIIALGILFVLISTIITLADYAKFTRAVNKHFDDLEIDYSGAKIPAKYWAALIVPTAFLLIGGITLVLCLFALIIIFKKDIDTSISEHENPKSNQMKSNQNQNINVNNYTTTQAQMDMNNNTNKGIITGTELNNNINPNK
jgi:hypothetical protein